MGCWGSQTRASQTGAGQCDLAGAFRVAGVFDEPEGAHAIPGLRGGGGRSECGL